MKKIVLMWGVLFICGIIAADICVRGLVNEDIILGLDVFREYAYAKMSFKDVIWNLLYERMKQFLCLLLFGITPLRKYIPVIVLGILSFCLGFFMMNCILALGFVGIVIGVASVLPHGFFYAGAYSVISGGERRHSLRQYQAVSKSVITYVWMILFFVTGCVIECVMGVHFIPWIIRLSFV